MKPLTPRWGQAALLLAGAIVAFASGEGVAPAYALHANALWRIEVGAASALLLWPVARSLVLAYHGWTLFGPLAPRRR